MKIGILTLPLHSNYGGNLQAWALMRTLRELGHEVWLIDLERYRTPWWRKPAVLLKQAFKRYVQGRRDVILGISVFDPPELARREAHARDFIARNIAPRTHKFSSTSDLARNITRYEFDAIVVGSDQVWRPQYTPNIDDHFLGFLGDAGRTRRVAYAASFGTEDWQFTDEQTARLGGLLKRFDAVALREDSGVLLCNEKFQVDARHVVDPTLLVDREDYIDLIGAGTGGAPGPMLFTYLLDKSAEKLSVLNWLQERTGLRPMTPADLSDEATRGGGVIPAVGSWIRGFRDADYVFTDSFHGCVFSIIFRKPFIAFGNPRRGLSRFTSLLAVFGLDERLVLGVNDIEKAFNSPIDWSKVERELDRQRGLSREFFSGCLK